MVLLGSVAPVHPLILRISRLFALLALLGMSGGHWVVLQSVAWSGMLVVNARASSFTSAVEKTFDGEHPCELCKNIAQSRKSEKKPDAPAAATKLEFLHQISATIFPQPRCAWKLASHDTARALRSDAPPLRPPRGCSAA